jgi:hypothetical protein
MGYDGSASARVLSPEGYCFLLDIDAEGGENRLEFQLMPDTIGESKAALYNEVPIVGRSLPLIGYSSSSSRMVALTLQFAALSADGKYTMEWVEKQVRWLESKVYPTYRDGYTFPPPRLLLNIGKAFAMQCVMLSYNTGWLGPWRVDGDSVRPMRATVDIQLQEWGLNDAASGHPHSTEEARAGSNQAWETGSGVTYVDIPLAVRG